MNTLRIETAENGFVVYEGDSKSHAIIGKTYAFETAESLAGFMLEWGQGNTRTQDENEPDTFGGKALLAKLKSQQEREPEQPRNVNHA